MTRRADLVGERFSRLTVVEDAHESRNGRALWKCVCDCGGVTSASTHDLRNGNTRSCGCLQRERTSEAARTHGRSGQTDFRLLHSARHRARQRGLPCTITIDDCRIPEICPVLGIPLEPGQGVQHDASPSLDRLHSDGGYTPNNVIVMSKKANTIKSNATSDQVLAVADWMESLGL